MRLPTVAAELNKYMAIHKQHLKDNVQQDAGPAFGDAQVGQGHLILP